MRSIMLFLVLGAVVFGGLLTNGIQPVHADDELQVGTYEGVIKLNFHSMAQQGYPGWDGAVTINWFAEGDLDLTITGEKYGTMTIIYIPVDIFDHAYYHYQACGDGSVGIKARGSFLGGTAGLNFDPQQKTGTLYLFWNGLDSVNTVWDNIQGCPLKGMSEPQITAIKETSLHIGKITVTVTNIDDIFITGNCRLPDWEGSGSLPYGSYTRILDSCNWWAFKDSAHGEGGKEWKNK